MIVFVAVFIYHAGIFRQKSLIKAIVIIDFTINLTTFSEQSMTFNNVLIMDFLVYTFITTNNNKDATH